MAGFGESLGWASNPWYKAFDANRSALVSGFAGLGGATPNNIGGGFAQGFASGMPMDERRAERAREVENQNLTMEWVKANYPQYADLPVEQASELAFKMEAAKKSGAGDSLMSVGGHLYDTATGQWISPPETAENRQNISLTPQWGQDAEGNPVMLQPSSTGELVMAQPPEGVTLLGPFGTSADRAAGSAFGKGVGGAQFDLPAAALTTQQTLDAIANVRSQTAGMDEQFGNFAGFIPQQLLPTLPKSERANFQVETNRLINRTFLEAREVLRGGGQITDFESRKAEGAISNLEEAMMRGDKALFQKSLDELEQAVRDGYAKLQAQAGAMPGYGPASPPSGPSANGKVLTYNPATGRLE